MHPRFSKEFVLESVKLILENKDVNFDNEYFHQVKDTVMGTIFAQTYANLTMGFFELTFYNLWRDKFAEDLGNLSLKTRAVFPMTVKSY